MENHKSIFNKLLQTIEAGKPAVLYTIIDTRGFGNLHEGARLLACPGGEKYGTLGIESMDEEMLSKAEIIFKRQAPITDIIESTVKILVESFFTEKRLIVFGGGHVALPLVEMASMLDYNTMVVDDRPEFANKGRFPGADEVLCAGFEDVLQGNLIPIDESTSVVIITRGHQHDQKCLEYVINSKARYIGMIGSSGKVKSVYKSLLNKGVSPEKIARVSAPIGLDLGGQKPAEIALSILGEMVARENGGSCKPLKEVKAVVFE